MDLSTQLFSSPTAAAWRRIGTSPHHGIDLPLFSLHSAQSCGIGEFSDLTPLIDWCHDIGLDVLQLLPVNDTGMDNSPYSAISAFALNPVHLGLASLAYVEADSLLKALLEEGRGLTVGERVHYGNVYAFKETFLRHYDQKYGARIRGSGAYGAFIQKNKSWLEPYALFKVLKAKHKWAPWQQWKGAFLHPTADQYATLCVEYQKEMDFHFLVQHLCFEQFQQVKKHAEIKKLFIKGDLPIFISRDSADVWFSRHLFDLDYSAGSPPDMYSQQGQNWGSPIYNWSTMEKEQYLWWRQRLEVAGHFYHLYRLDHIVGFFRIWAIPMGGSGKEGHFIPQDPDMWIPHGEKILRMMVANSEMLPIGEDLGVVPGVVKECLARLGICGTKVIRWERRWKGDKGFIPYTEYPQFSMTTVSTHDSDTLEMWWERCPEEAQLFSQFRGIAFTRQLSPAFHEEILHDSHHTASLFHINLLQEYLALIPEMRWGNIENERINIPGSVAERNWSYRFRPSVEAITCSVLLKQLIQRILK
jgi:4-alpha-glucanotransferase